MYAEGLGVEKNDMTAIKLFSEAYEGGIVQARDSLKTLQQIS